MLFKVQAIDYAEKLAQKVGKTSTTKSFKAIYELLLQKPKKTKLQP